MVVICSSTACSRRNMGCKADRSFLQDSLNKFVHTSRINISRERGLFWRCFQSSQQPVSCHHPYPELFEGSLTFWPLCVQCLQPISGADRPHDEEGELETGLGWTARKTLKMEFSGSFTEMIKRAVCGALLEIKGLTRSTYGSLARPHWRSLFGSW